MSHLVVDDPTWKLPSSPGTPVTPRRLRVWETHSGELLAVITEDGSGDGQGGSISDVAEDAYATVRRDFPNARVFEHFPADGEQEETFDEITVADGHASRTLHSLYDIAADFFFPLRDSRAREVTRRDAGLPETPTYIRTVRETA